MVVPVLITRCVAPARADTRVAAVPVFVVVAPRLTVVRPAVAARAVTFCAGCAVRVVALRADVALRAVTAPVRDVAVVVAVAPVLFPD